MPFSAIVLSILAAGSAIAWLALWFATLDFRRDHPRLAERKVEGTDGAPAGAASRVTVIVPANNEEGSMGACIESLRAQTYQNMRLVVVNDRSTDRTEQVAIDALGDDPRARLITVEELPAGWTGKTHALTLGAGEAIGAGRDKGGGEEGSADDDGTQWLLFTDADTVHQPGCVESCVAWAEETGADMLSGWPAIGTKSWAPRVVDSMCGSVLASWYKKRGRGDGRRVKSFANGQFILIRRAMYEQIGGHEAFRDRLLEDIAVGRAVGRAEGHIELVRLTDLVEVNTYASFAESHRGWTRIFLEGSRRKPGRLLRPAFILPVIGWGGIVPLLVSVAAIFTRTDGTDWWWPAALGATGWGLMTMTIGLVNRMTRVPVRYALLAPIAALLVARSLWTAAGIAKRNAGVEWHGVEYKFGRAD